MELKDVKNLFSATISNDSKHKLNTTNKAISLDVLSEIEYLGITLERLNELSEQGYDIYKYSTQITLHGICKELSNDRICGYKCLVLNKNKSIGIKYIAVDNDKKHRITDVLGEFGWNTKCSSSELYPFMMKRFKSVEEAISKCNEYKEIAERIDKDLFYGSYSIYIGNYMGMFYVVFDLYINAILKSNVDKLLECVLGMNINDINSEIQAKDRARELEKKQWREAWEEEEKKKKERGDRLRNELLSEGYVDVGSKSLANNTTFIVIEDDKVVEYTKTARTCKPNDWRFKNNNTYNLYDKKVWVKK